jgi:SAM-dependent methyltransferase
VDHWQFVDATPAERALFADLAATLALPYELAAPPNRHREVRRIEVQGAVWFLKVFHRTQWKNRVRFRLSRPAAADDAERELRVTQALRAAAIAVPRAVSIGRAGASSFYLCAPLPGVALRDLLAAGAVTSATAAAAATFCGDLLAQGFHLPDLSANHVFVDQQPGGPRFGLLDLHNGSVGGPGAAPARLCVRVLRHFQTSVRDLGGSRRARLTFAVRLLAAARPGLDHRSVLRRLPPDDTAARYEVPGRSIAYGARSHRRGEREQLLLGAVWPGRGGECVLDAPCGTGRLLPLLRDTFGARVCWADGASAMLKKARADHGDAVPAVRADALHLPFGDRCFDGVLMFRFLHHLPPARQQQAIAEACRCSRDFVVFSFFHPCSLHHLWRRLSGLLRGTASARFPMTLGRLRRIGQRAGFELHRVAADQPYVRDLWVVSLIRRPLPPPA